MKAHFIVIRLVALACAIVLAACSGAMREKAPTEVEVTRYLADKPPQLIPLYEKVIRGGRSNLVLNHMEAGLAAMEIGEYDWARHSFEIAAREIETVFADNERAAKARGLWYEEGKKVFKGEPYERAMVYYYLGILDMMRGDYENARAAFKSGILQDAFAEEKQNRADFALLIFLEGWASQCLGDEDLTRAAYDEALKLRPDLRIPPPDHNTLILVETGKSPRKLADGVGHYELVYRRGKNFEEKAAMAVLPGGAAKLYPIEDIAWQAMTRGGRPIDRILEGQVVFKRTNIKIGTVMSEAATGAIIASTASDRYADEFRATGVALGLVSVVPLAIASQVKTRADTRYWSNLPDAVHAATAKLDRNNLEADIVYLDEDGRMLSSMREKTRAIPLSEKRYLIWDRSRDALQQALNKP
ncbi:MAG: hypothetical protein ACLFUS_11305 [Candidatus Sumerlaeia bacterium]